MDNLEHSKIIDFLKTGIVDSTIHNKSKFKAKCSNFIMKNDLLRYKCNNKIVVTADQVRNIVYNAHTGIGPTDFNYFFKFIINLSKNGKLETDLSPIGPEKHLSFEETYRILQDMYYWPNIDKSVQKYINKCPVCTKGVPREYLQKFDLFGIDILGPFPETQEGYKYLLVSTEHHTKWVDVIPLKDKKVETVAYKIVKDIVFKYKMIKYLETNQDEEFDSKLISLLKFGRLYPDTKGETVINERFANMVFSLLNENKKAKWAELHDNILIDYNIREFGPDKKSPYYSLFGVKHVVE